MHGELKDGLRKLALQKGRVYGFTFTTVILSMISSCERININENNINVADPILLVVMNNLGNDRVEIEELDIKNDISLIPTVTPTPEPTPTLTPEEEALKEYENYFNIYDFCYIEEDRDRYIEYFKEYPDMPALDAMTYVNIGLDKEYYTNITDIVNPASPLVICNKYNKLPNDYVPEGFSKETQKTTVLHGDAGEACEKMIEAAKKDGLRIYSISSYRSFKYQKDRYDDKVRARGQADVDKTNARPGYSEHQTGLAADFISVDDSFENTEEGKWLAENAYKFGYILRYPKGKDKEKITGYNYEPWHFRYVGVKIATVIKKTGLTYDEFYARYIEKVVLEHPEASKLSGDEFFDKYLTKYFVKGHVFVDYASVDKDLVYDINVALAQLSDYQFAVSNGYIDKEDEEVLVLSNTK
jgi:D-alanyl-D-alanine carboxypeptidase